MRIVMIAATEAGIEVCCSVHDGFLIIAPLERLDRDVARMTTIMKAAGKALLGVNVLVGKPDVVRWPDRFVPENKKGSHDTFRLILRELKRLDPDNSPPLFTPASPPHVKGEMAEMQTPAPLPTPTPRPPI